MSSSILERPFGFPAEDTVTLSKKGLIRATVLNFRVEGLSEALEERRQAFSGVRQKNAKREIQGYWAVAIL
ncbi:MAG: hypothetical protein QG552_1847 [Thermodesulfobacteriota bacterium]|nr:hypothetical protein [Thermodesulfobacteriota bacterium]